MKKDRLWSLFLFAAVIFMIVCGCRLIQIVFRYQEADSLYDDIEKEVFEPDIPAEDGKNQKEENDTGVKPAVDFQKLILWAGYPYPSWVWNIRSRRERITSITFIMHITGRQTLLAVFSWIIGIWKIFRTRTRYCMDIIC